MSSLRLSPLILISMLATACTDDGGARGLASKEKAALKYAESVTLIAGEARKLSPEDLKTLEDDSAQCAVDGALPEWMTFDPVECSVQVSARHTGDWSYKVTLTVEDQDPVEATLMFSVVAPDESTLPAAANPPPTSNYYMLETLAADSNYVAAFDGSAVQFLDMTNPYQPSVIASITAASVGAGNAQALVSIGDRIHAVTHTGYVVTFDWSTRSAPVHENSFLVDSGGQNFDVASDGEGLLFIANTTHTRFSVIDVSTPTSPSLVYKDDTLGGFGAGVAYLNGYVYVAAYQGAVVTYGLDSSGDWERKSSVNTSFAAAMRPFAKGDKLIVPRYNGILVDVFSVSDPGTPVLLETLTLPVLTNPYARPLIHDGTLYVLTSGSPSQILTYSVPAAHGALVAGTPLTPACPGEESCGGLNGLTTFRGGSFMAFVGSDPNTGTTRHIMTSLFP